MSLRFGDLGSKPGGLLHLYKASVSRFQASRALVSGFRILRAGFFSVGAFEKGLPQSRSMLRTL